MDLAARLGWVCLRLSDFVCVWMVLATGFGWVWLDLAGLGGGKFGWVWLPLDVFGC